jgi:carboxyl-terminal processing protease
VVVTYVWPGGSAEEAGVRRGWILETCDGEGARAYLQDRIFEIGQKLACAFRDEHDQPRQLELVARPVEHPPVREVRVLAGGCVYLRFDEFKYPATKWLYEQLRAHRRAPAVILDQRYNTGGDVAYLEYIAGLFLPRGQEIGTFAKRGEPSETVNSRRPLFASRYPGGVAIIVSTSAAEIFADAMQHFHRAIIVGQATAGRVLNAYQVALPDGGELSFSVRDYFTSDGRRLEGNGVAPDAVIEYQLADLRAGQDPGIDVALLALRQLVIRTDR